METSKQPFPKTFWTKAAEPVEDDDRAQVYEVFKQYEATRGKVSIENLPTILRLLGHNIGVAES